MTGVFTPLQQDLFHKINSYQVGKVDTFVSSQMFSTNFAYCERGAGVI